MKFIAIKSFRNNCGIEIKNAMHPDHVHMGAEFEIGLDLPFELLTPEEQLLVRQLRSADCICDAEDVDRVQKARAEVAADKARDRRDKREPLTFDRRLILYTIIIAILGVIVGLIAIESQR